MFERYVLRWERNRVLETESGKEEHWLVVVELGNVLEKVLLESESGKEEHWLVVVELGNVLEKVLLDFGKLF